MLHSCDVQNYENKSAAMVVKKSLEERTNVLRGWSAK